MKRLLPVGLAILAVTFLPAASTSSQDAPLGLFEKHGDIGLVGRSGNVDYDPAQKTYLITGGGENMWGATDAFHFVWKQVGGESFWQPRLTRCSASIVGVFLKLTDSRR